MQRATKIIIPILLVVVIIASIGWYFLSYDRAMTRDMLLSYARFLDKRQNYTMATFFYDLAYDFGGKDDAIAIEIARQHREYGNFTKAESILHNAIIDGASVDLYIAYCQTFVMQDKLLDAVTLLDNIEDPKIKAEIDALRPMAPSAFPEPGDYEEIISVNLTSAQGKVYATTEGTYPTQDKHLVKTPIQIVDGSTTIHALTINADGLVSTLVPLDYKVSNVIRQVKFADPAIERIVRELLGVSDSMQIFTNDLWNIESLVIPMDATTLADLSLFPNLKQLAIQYGKFPSLTTLADLVSLEELVISNTDLSSEDIEAISTMSKLTALTLSGCGISSVQPLSSLTKLTYLDLNNNTIRDLTALEGMTELTYLDLSHNAVVGLDTLSKLKNLNELDLSFNSITSTAPLSKCENLAYLTINNNLLTSLSGLNNLKKLGALSVAFNKLTNVNVLTSNTSLVELDISNNAITDISALSVLDNLYTLNFSYNKIKKIPSFGADSHLSYIKGSQNQISSLTPLSQLQYLSEVYMDYNSGISSINPLTSCPSLSTVSVYGTGVRDISAFKDTDVVIMYQPL